MTDKSLRRSSALPPHVDPHDPRTLSWRVDQIEERVTDLEQAKPSSIGDHIPKLPWQALAMAILYVLAIKLGWLTADDAARLLGR
jgi:hypothetical protein